MTTRAKTEPGVRMERAERALTNALRRYDRRAWAWVNADGGALWDSTRSGTGAQALVRQARDLAGRLEAMVYDGVGL